MRFPCNIRPELIEIGDRVRVTFPERDGVTMTHEGTVTERHDHGAVRYLYTDQGGTLFAWEPGKRHGLTVTLLARAPAPQVPLFDMA